MDRFGPYAVHECLGAGGMATVHRATLELEDGTFRDVALKRLLPQYADDRRFVDDFIREAKLASHLTHPNIVRILELGRIGRTYFIAMELVRGEPLMTLMRRALQQKRKSPVGVVLALAGELCDALDHAHELHIVHRDLSPSNLLVTNHGHLKVIDYGVAKALSGALQTSSGLAKGKIGYMSPEAVEGRSVDTRADLWSAGVVMWELIAGKRLFRAANDWEVLVQIREMEILPPSAFHPDCPTELDDIVLRALARPLDARWASAAEMSASVEGLAALEGEAARAPEVARWKQQLRADSLVVAARLESEGAAPAVRLPTEEVLAEVEAPDEIGEGSRSPYEEIDALMTYDGPIETVDTVDTFDRPVSVRDEDEPDADEVAARGKRFREVDTIITRPPGDDRER